jgi:hypothetical protein
MLEKVKKVIVADDDAKEVVQRIAIPEIRMATREFLLIGVTPLVSNNFGKEMQDKMAERQKKGSQANKDRIRKPKDFEADFRASLHVSTEGWIGFPASTFRQALVDACRAVGYKMTLAKMAVFVLADGEDVDSGQPLVKVLGPKPERFTTYVRLADGSPDIKSRGRWKEWKIKLSVEFDEDMFSAYDVSNLLIRVGRQVGIGAGRPFSKTSCGQDWGRFRLSGSEEDSGETTIAKKKEKTK